MKAFQEVLNARREATSVRIQLAQETKNETARAYEEARRAEIDSILSILKRLTA